MPNFVMSYLGSTVTPGSGESVLALMYVLIIFAGVSVQ